MGEKAAIHYLTEKGYTIIHSNYRTKIGEIDIIAQQKNVLVFAEVKTRRNKNYGTPAEAVTYRKRQKIVQTAYYYLKQSGRMDSLCRFDILEILLDNQNRCHVYHIINAFGE
jgi:putative endonuclease